METSVGEQQVKTIGHVKGVVCTFYMSFYVILFEVG